LTGLSKQIEKFILFVTLGQRVGFYCVGRKGWLGELKHEVKEHGKPCHFSGFHGMEV
jgi:hypothetical protein